MKKILLVLLLVGQAALGSIIVFFNPVTGQVTGRADNVQMLDYAGRTDVVAVMSLPTINLALCKVTNGTVVLWNADELLAQWMASSNAAVAAGITDRSNTIAFAKTFADGTNDVQRFVRALFTVTLDMINRSYTNAGWTKTTKSAMLSNVLYQIDQDPK